jgi:SagB-type dehydrogenase family enzyme
MFEGLGYEKFHNIREIMHMDKRNRQRELLRLAAICIILVLGMTILVLTRNVALAEEQTIQLSNPQTDHNPFLQLLMKRASARSFSSEPLPGNVLSNLLWAAAGISRPESGRRTAPTASNRQEMDVYAATAKGLYLYEAKSNTLKLILAKDIREMTGKQPYVKDAAVNLIYVADYAKMNAKSEEDRMIYAASATGFISENVYLYCASEGLATVVRAFIDRPALAEVMKLRPDQKIILAQSVGYPKK